MTFRRTFGVLGFVAAFALLPLCRAADDPGADALKSKDLVKSGTSYVLAAEQETADAMKGLRKLKVKLEADSKQRRALETELRTYKNGISSLEYKKVGLLEQYGKLKDVTQQNAIVAQVNIITAQLTEAKDRQSKIAVELDHLGTDDNNNFVNGVIDLGIKVDKAQDDYKGLAGDPDVKETLDKMNQPGKPKMKLGPTPEFTKDVTTLKKWRGDVASDNIPLKKDSGVPNVDVLLNGKITREMVVDSGAAIVCLTADIAKDLNMVPTEKDETLQLTMADGKLVECKKMVLTSIRVGQFTVTDVDCAILPASLVAAQPLLGGSFLNNFVMKMDPKAGELHLAVIAGNSKVTTATGAKDPKKTGSTSEK